MQILTDGDRKITGVLKGYDVFLNITLMDAIETLSLDKMSLGLAVIRGNSIVLLEALS